MDRVYFYFGKFLICLKNCVKIFDMLRGDINGVLER